MALVKATLEAQLNVALAKGLSGAGRKEQAQAIADAYNSYGMTAQSCALLPPSLVNYAPLKSQLESAMSQTYTNPGQPAQQWANAFQTFWTGALFGATGLVTLVPGTPALQAQLLQLFSTPTPDPLLSFVAKFTTALDSFTKLVVVQDTALPVPPGCLAPLV